MAVEDIKRDFPALDSSCYSPPRSPADFNYNCLAFVLGDLGNWWEPPALFGHYWPPGFPEDVSVETAMAILNLHGYTVEMNDLTKFQKDAVAIYAIGLEWTHFAKFADGKWASKLGEGHDIQHSRLEEIEGPIYGKVVKILRKKE
jgi:hypothetical protein